MKDHNNSALDEQWRDLAGDAAAGVLASYNENYPQDFSGRPFPSPPSSEHSVHCQEHPHNTGTPESIADSQHRQSLKSTRVPRNRRNRRPAAGKGEKPRAPKLTVPLSEITKNYDHIPMRNMESWVHRSAEARHAEAEKRGGYVTRPMNSFMLYRSAYAERTKFWCLQNNHQVVSSVSGESWPLEPVHIREHYNELARIERENHQAAHPGYKFSPSKVQRGIKRNSGRGTPRTESVCSDLDGGQSPSESSSAAMKRRKMARAGKKNNVKAIGNNPLVYLGVPYSFEKTEGGPMRSSFQHSNPGKTPPKCMKFNDLIGQYYQTTIRASSNTPIQNSMGSAIIEDVTIKKTHSPASGARWNTPNTEYPGNSGLSYGWPPSLHNMQEEFDGLKVDPALLADSTNNEDACWSTQSTNQPEYSFQSGGMCSNATSFADEGMSPGQHLPNAVAPRSFAGNGYADSYGDSQMSGNPYEPQYTGSFVDSPADLHSLVHTPDPSAQLYLEHLDSGWNTPEACPPDDVKLCYDEWLQ